MTPRPDTLYHASQMGDWYHEMRQDPVWGATRFKLLATVLFDHFQTNKVPVPIEDYDWVEWLPYVREEPDRLPLLPVSQFGNYGYPQRVPGLLSPGKRIALLNRSDFSGYVSGVSIYSVSPDIPPQFPSRELSKHLVPVVEFRSFPR
jgi:hypothetical protein